MDDSDRDERPKIDLSPALGEGGHEVEELGYEGVADDGPLVDEAARAHEDPLADEIAVVEFPTD